MIRRLLLVVILVVWRDASAFAAITLLSHCGDPSGSPSCASGIDTTNATLLVGINGTNASTCPGAGSPSAGSWTQQETKTGGGFNGTYTLCYINNPTTSSSQTFACGGTLCGVTILAYSGTDTSSPLDTSCSAASNKCAASVTPANNGSLIVAGTGGPWVSGLSIDSGLTIRDAINGVGGVSYGADSADLVQATAAAIQPTWDESAHGIGVAMVAVFKPSAGGGGGSPIGGQALSLLGVGMAILLTCWTPAAWGLYVAHQRQLRDARIQRLFDTAPVPDLVLVPRLERER